MVASKADGDNFLSFDQEVFVKELTKVIQSLVPRLDRVVNSYVRFNLFFLLLLSTEVSLLLGFFGFLLQSSLVAIALSLIFLTVFSYFILKTYLIAKKPEQFDDFVERFARGAESLIKYREGIPEHHYALATAFSKMAAALNRREYAFFKPPMIFSAFSPTCEKISCNLFWQDFHQMKEMLLKRSIEEHLKLIRCEPTNLEVHASLASAYINLSNLYHDPRESEGYDSEIWIPANKYTPALKEKFSLIAKRAIEEFKILESYAPNDTWVHSQLAYSYHDLNMPLEEIGEWEAIIRLRPDDKESLFKLGKLYFSQGMNGKGLRIYEELRASNYTKAEELIKYYGSWNSI
ncbi:tetratricopeptide repeat protein [Estrella lausannensis]|uniref:Conserved putative membrane protein n=1 Tax=Estrella lausannensis TaxID=483423 RepID=A0A0H5E2R1_9BACT|nr:hypothetical protein [Estrella lausannensis]CRX37485.1 Conserved putative membrane protein [Estrella lausannensis]